MNSSFKDFIEHHVRKQETIWLIGLGLMCLLRLSFFLDVARFEIDRLILYQVDDAFYYNQIAKNFGSGFGFTFDGVEANNGFHPLYAYLLAAFYAMGWSDNDVIKAACFILSGATVLAVVMLFGIIRELTKSGFLAFLGASIWLLHPWTFYGTVSGMESNLYLGLLLATLYYYLTRVQTTPLPHLKLSQFVILGTMMGLTFLARTETGFLGLILPVDLLIRNRRFIIKSKTEVLFTVRASLAYSASIILICSHWIYFNLFNFGTLSQVSGTHHRLNNLSYLKDVFLEPVSSRMEMLFVQSFSHFPSYYFDVWSQSLFDQVTKGYFWYFVGVLIACSLALSGTSRRHIAEALKRVGFIFSFQLVLISYYSFYLLHIVWERYFYFYGIIITLLFMLFLVPLGVLGKTKLSSRKSSLLAFSFSLVSVAVMSFIGFSTNTRQEYLSGGGRFRAWLPENLEFKSAADYLTKKYPDSTLFGGFNCGILGFYTQGRFVNLDGIVNNRAMNAMKTGHLIDYIKSRGIEYIVDGRMVLDPNLSTESYFHRFGRLSDSFKEAFEFVEIIPGTGFYGGIAIYRVKEPGSRLDLSSTKLLDGEL